MVDILKNEDDRMIVKLSENYAFGIKMTTAALAENVVIIDFLCSGYKSKRTILTGDEMNALVDAWTMFKHTQQVAKEVEQQRIVKLVEDAKRRIEELGATAITIEQDSEDDWFVLRYSHKPKWDERTVSSGLDSALTALLERIQERRLPLTIENTPASLSTGNAF